MADASSNETRERVPVLAGHLPGASNVPHDLLEGRLDELAPLRVKDIVAYYGAGRRAGLALAALAQHGYTRLLHLDGAMQGWLAAARPVETTPAEEAPAAKPRPAPPFPTFAPGETGLPSGWGLVQMTVRLELLPSRTHGWLTWELAQDGVLQVFDLPAKIRAGDTRRTGDSQLWNPDAVGRQTSGGGGRGPLRRGPRKNRSARPEYASRLPSVRPHASVAVA